MQYSQNSITLSQAILELHSFASQPSSSSASSSQSALSIPTHSSALNSLVNVRNGTIQEICGAPGTGKTAVALDLTSQCLITGNRVLWLTTRGRAASLPLGQTDLPASQSSQPQQQQRRLNAPERTWRQLGHMVVDGVSQLLVLFTHWWKHNLHLSQGTRLVVIDDFGHLMRGVPVRMAARVLVEMKRAAQEYGFAVVVMSRLLAQWSVTGRRMMMVPGLPALTGVLDGRIVLCRDGSGGRVAARVQTGSGPDPAVLEVVRRVQFEVLADRVVDAVENRDSDDDDDDDAYPNKRLRIENHQNNKAGNPQDNDEDGFSDIDFDDLVSAEKKDEIKKKSLLRIGDNSSDAKLKLQGFMTSGELMQSMVEQGDLSSSHEDKPNVGSENGSTSPISQEEAQGYSANPIDVATSENSTTGAKESTGKSLTDNAKSTCEADGLDNTTIIASNVVGLGSSPLSGNMGNDPITLIVEVSSPEFNNNTKPVPSNGKPSHSNSSIPGNNSLALASTAIVEVSSQEPGDNVITSLPPSAVDISSPESTISEGLYTKPLVEVADSQDFGSDEIKLPNEFILPNSSSTDSSQNL